MDERTPSRRVVLLGASNLAMSFATAVAAARGAWGAPLDIMAAMGHGRSYGQDSTVLGRKISGIFPCALWHDLQRRKPLPTAALMTDIGNDLMYGVPIERIMEWVAGCIDGLTGAGATTIVTQLPVASIERLGEARFRFFRSVFFPRCRLSLSAAKEGMRELNGRLIELGQLRKIAVIPVSESWYGFDPIHVRRRFRAEAWPALMSAWQPDVEAVKIERAPLWRRVYLASLPPLERTLLGIRQRAAQPSGRFRDGTTISLY